MRGHVHASVEPNDLSSDARDLLQRVRRVTVVVPLLVTVALGVMFAWQVERLLTAMRWVEHTDLVIERTREIESRTSRVVREAREQLVTGPPQTQYGARKAEIEAAARSLVELVRDNPAQHERAKILLQNVNEVLAEAAAAARSGSSVPGSPKREVGEGGRHPLLGEAMNTLARQFDSFVEVEQSLRDQRRDTAGNASRFATWSALTMALLVGGALALQGSRALTLVSRRYERANARVLDLAESHRQSEEQARSIIEGVMGHAIVLLTPDGRVKRWNAGAERLKGYGSEEIIGKPFSLFFTEQDRQNGVPERLLAEAREKGVAATQGWRVRKDGTTFYGLGTLSALRDGTGQVFALVKIIRDMTEHRQAEERILQLNQTLERRVEERTAELAAVNRELEAFSYSVSHDLRAPLRSVDGFSRILQERYAAVMDAQGQHYLARIRAAAQRMGVLIEDLLRLSRVTRADMTFQDVDLAEIARRSIDELRRADPERDVVFESPASVPVRGDRRLLEIAVENLLSNAWKFTSQRAQARIELGTRQDPDGCHEYFVRDNGVGFDMAFAGKLFAPFQRLHDAEEFPGTGIGLATVQRVVTRHGGRIRAESAPDAGATFIFTLGDA